LKTALSCWRLLTTDRHRRAASLQQQSFLSFQVHLPVSAVVVDKQRRRPDSSWAAALWSVAEEKRCGLCSRRSRSVLCVNEFLRVEIFHIASASYRQRPWLTSSYAVIIRPVLCPRNSGRSFAKALCPRITFHIKTEHYIVNIHK